MSKSMKCRRCKKISTRPQLVVVKKNQHGMETLGCPHCFATVFTQVEPEAAQ
ncbi:hypothetical protein [Enterobacter cloacae]|uniref:hypothetical protein n=1 Tax=Enterobacter cloacae TaxID=550 RepID=UPI002FD7FD24